MTGSFTIKGITIGKGKPVICVPVTAETEEGVLEAVQTIVREQQDVQMLEWRADYFENLEDPQAVRKVLEKLRPLCQDRILLFTIRTAKQGGNAQIPENLVIRLNETAAASGAADLVDLELFEASKPEKEIRRLHDRGVRVIASHHDFDHTPDDHILRILMKQMNKSNADVAKLAVMPERRQDVLRLLQLTLDTREKYPEMPLITMSMGGIGTLSRVSGELSGSCVTFGTAGRASAPGQLPVEELAQILEILHRSQNGSSAVFQRQGQMR